jgi:hypothetical protein
MKLSELKERKAGIHSKMHFSGAQMTTHLRKAISLLFVDITFMCNVLVDIAPLTKFREKCVSETVCSWEENV